MEIGDPSGIAQKYRVTGLTDVRHYIRQVASKLGLATTTVCSRRKPSPMAFGLSNLKDEIFHRGTRRGFTSNRGCPYRFLVKNVLP